MASVVSRSFPAGAKVQLIRRQGDWFRDGAVEKTATVKDDGTVEFKNVEGAYWLTDGETTVGTVAKENDERQRLSDDEVRERLAATRPPVQGNHGSDAKVSREATGVPEAHEKSKGRFEPQPHTKQADVSGPQRSDTPLGQATPKDPAEEQPRVAQRDNAGPQRSDTPLGEFTPKVADEQQPARTQEDAKGKQRSDTPEGQAEPKPKASKREVEQAKDSAESKALGATVPKAGTSKGSRATKKVEQKASARKVSKEHK